ncbi:TIGR02117 family protein [Jiella avicenniae]|uniref:TIGR02117 family protein n=1 Tax=Jiella avicenniae TaxID=2907202 RepID=A0A9X1P0L3_9HYPH|nr:TIGR02117 family protein [Jiella avicenniae]MCE7029220.1 TIGR02117 family protein [Jiella avicenniae]
MLKRRPRRLFRGLRVAGLLLLLGLGSLVLGVAVPRGDAPASGGTTTAEPRRILLLAGPIHSDIALPADTQTRRDFAFLAKAGLPVDRPDVRWIIVGWGGRSFYTETPTWADLKPMPLLRTLTGDAAALHVGLAGSIDATSPDVEALELTQRGYADLRSSVMASFSRGADGRPVEIAGTAYGAFDRFYEADGRFHIIGNCNGWAAAMLRRAGITTGWWTPLPQLLFLSLDLHHGS